MELCARNASRATRWLGRTALGLAIVLCGCGQHAPEPEKVEVAKTGPDKKDPAPPPPSDRLHQPFLQAVTLDPPEGQRRPPDKTKAGKNVAKLYETIAGPDGVGGLWDKIRFTSSTGKSIRYTATIKTDMGDIGIELLSDLAPNHVRNFIALAWAGYYDGLEFDRAFYEELPEDKGNYFECIQAGCPLGTGDPALGSIGYWVKAEVNPDVKHEVGTVGAWHGEPLEWAACKFYIILGKAPGMENYTIFGKVTQGLDVARKIRALPVRPDEKDRPQRPVVMRAVTVSPDPGMIEATARGN